MVTRRFVAGRGSFDGPVIKEKLVEKRNCALNFLSQMPMVKKLKVDK